MSIDGLEIIDYAHLSVFFFQFSPFHSTMMDNDGILRMIGRIVCVGMTNLEF